MSYSSLLEVINQLILSNDLGFIDDDTLMEYRKRISELSNKINAFHRKLINK